MKTHYVSQIRVNGKTVEESKTQYFGNKESFLGMKREFFNHLKNAITSPETFSFTGFAMTDAGAAEFISFHEKRLGVKLEGRFELISDDKLIDSFYYSEI